MAIAPSASQAEATSLTPTPNDSVQAHISALYEAPLEVRLNIYGYLEQELDFFLSDTTQIFSECELIALSQTCKRLRTDVLPLMDVTMVHWEDRVVMGGLWDRISYYVPRIRCVGIHVQQNFSVARFSSLELIVLRDDTWLMYEWLKISLSDNVILALPESHINRSIYHGNTTTAEFIREKPRGIDVLLDFHFHGRWQGEVYHVVSITHFISGRMSLTVV